MKRWGSGESRQKAYQSHGVGLPTLRVAAFGQPHLAAVDGKDNARDTAGTLMRKGLRQHPFLVLGLATLLLFVTVEFLRMQGAADASQRLAAPLRLLILPMYLVWLAFTLLNVALWGAAGVASPVSILFYSLQLIGGLGPYVTADTLLRRWRAAKARRQRAAGPLDGPGGTGDESMGLRGATP